MEHHFPQIIASGLSVILHWVAIHGRAVSAQHARPARGRVLTRSQLVVRDGQAEIQSGSGGVEIYTSFLCHPQLVQLI